MLPSTTVPLSRIVGGLYLPSPRIAPFPTMTLPVTWTVAGVRACARADTT
jgi:hypothetical protein